MFTYLLVRSYMCALCARCVAFMRHFVHGTVEVLIFIVIVGLLAVSVILGFDILHISVPYSQESPITFCTCE